MSRIHVADMSDTSAVRYFVRMYYGNSKTEPIIQPIAFLDQDDGQPHTISLFHLSDSELDEFRQLHKSQFGKLPGIIRVPNDLLVRIGVTPELVPEGSDRFASRHHEINITPELAGNLSSLLDSMRDQVLLRRCEKT